jgi:menaquinone-dependent protoporphyrinogen IX oxidase
MRAAIFFSGKFGSTREYAQWLGEATGLPVFDVRKDPPEPWNYDLLILGSSVMVGKPTISKWVQKNWAQLNGRQLLLFSVSGTAPEDPDLRTWMKRGLGEEIFSQMDYVPLRGRMVLSELPLWSRILLKGLARVIKDPEESKRMTEGFDYMDRESLEPILRWYEKYHRPAKAEKKEYMVEMA